MRGRGWLYRVAAWWGDAHAVRRGRVGRRVVRRVAGRGTGRLFRKVLG